MSTIEELQDLLKFVQESTYYLREFQPKEQGGTLFKKNNAAIGAAITQRVILEREIQKRIEKYRKQKQE